MGIEKFVEQAYPVECKGKSFDKEEVLDKPVKARIIIYKRPGSSTISSQVNCKYNTGGHGDRCSATSDNAYCPYSFDIPHALDKKR